MSRRLAEWDGTGRGDPDQEERIVDDLTLVARYPDEAAANDVARSLVERGLGATVAEVPPPPPEPVDAESPPPPAAASTADDTDGAALEAPAWPSPKVPSSAAQGEGDWGVWTVPVDARRAAVLLGFEAPALIDDPDSELGKPPVPWKKVLIIWAIMLVVLPVMAFFAAYYLTN